MKIGDLVRHDEAYIGVVTCVDDNDRLYDNEVEVYWNDGDVCIMSIYDLEVICKSVI